MPRLSPLLIAATFLTAACGGASQGSIERGPRENVVAVTSGPARLVAEAIVGADHVRSVAPVGALMSTWRPPDDVLTALVAARRVVVIGAGFEPWVQRAGLPPSRTIALADRGPRERWIKVGAIEHTHGGGESHSHGGVVPTVWTDPPQLRAFLSTCARELPSAIDGLEAQSSKASRRALEGRIDAYEEALDGLHEALSGRALIATDHGLEYIARAAGIELEVTLLELDEPGEPGSTGATPNDQGIRDLEALAADTDRHAGILVWPSGLDEEFAARIQSELGLISVHFDLGGALGDASSADTLGRLMSSIARLRSAVLAATPR